MAGGPADQRRSCQPRRQLALVVDGHGGARDRVGDGHQRVRSPRHHRAHDHRLVLAPLAPAPVARDRDARLAADPVAVGERLRRLGDGVGRVGRVAHRAAALQWLDEEQVAGPAGRMTSSCISRGVAHEDTGPGRPARRRRHRHREGLRVAHDGAQRAAPRSGQELDRSTSGPPSPYSIRHSGGPAATTGRIRRTSRGHPSSPTTRSTSTSPAGIGPATCTPNASSADAVDAHANHLQRLDRPVRRRDARSGASPPPPVGHPCRLGLGAIAGSRIGGQPGRDVGNHRRRVRCPARRPRRRDADDQRGVIRGWPARRTLRQQPAPPRHRGDARRPGPPRGRYRWRQAQCPGRRARRHRCADARRQLRRGRQRRVVAHERRPRPVTRIAVGGRSGRRHMAHRSGRSSDSGETIRADSNALSCWRPRWRRERTAGTDVPTIAAASAYDRS